MEHGVRLTTIDNPYDPFTQFDQWYMYDVLNGYNTSAYLARVADTSDTNSEQENEEIVEKAIDEIIKYDVTGKYIRVFAKNKE